MKAGLKLNLEVFGLVLGYAEKDLVTIGNTIKAVGVENVRNA